MTIRERIDQLLNLCGEDPSAALAATIDALPLYRDEAGWIAVRDDGTFLFVDHATGRVTSEVPRDWVERAVEHARERYPELAPLRRHTPDT
ncbi:MAG TPA: hypothetical protein VF701_17140 [Thermoanaerobaculia bacterium]